MAVYTKSENVIRIDADNDTLSGSFYVEKIVYIPGTGSPTAHIKKTDTNGMVLWECSGASALYVDACIRLTGTTHIDLAGTGTVLYLYTRIE